MNASVFVTRLANIRLTDVFNPYVDRCDVHDKVGAPAVRRKLLVSYLEALQAAKVRSVWMGRDLGYRGGRRTGIAFTDDHHLPQLAVVYPGVLAQRSTFGVEVKERTASEIWGLLPLMASRPLLWNVFPFHPHEPGRPFSNRRFSARELNAVEEINRELFLWLGIQDIVAIGQDAASYAERLGFSISVVRHPSYGGLKDFRAGMKSLYGIEARSEQSHTLTLL